VWHSDPFLAVTAALSPLREQALNHDVYRLISHPQALTVFVEHHVFAVWDYAALYTAAHDSADSLSVRRASAALDEYRRAMVTYGADTRTIDQFEALTGAGTPWPHALDRACVPRAAARFVSRTLTLCQERSPIDLAATLLFGRERLMPSLYRRLAESLAVARSSGMEGLLAHFRQPGQKTMLPQDSIVAVALADRCGRDPSAWQSVYHAACAALHARLAFWDGIATAIRRRDSLGRRVAPHTHR
jgi:hypothetical protein